MKRQATYTSLPVADWPENDRLAWQAALTPGRLLRPGGAASHLAVVTMDDLRRRYACFLQFTRQQSLLKVDDGPAASVTPAAVRAYMEHLAPRVSSVTLAGSMRKISRTAELLAPEQDWQWLRQYVVRLERHMCPRDKRPRVVDVRRLLALGTHLMQAAEANAALTDFQRAQQFRDGLMVALLTASELRLGVFVELAIGSTLSRSGNSWAIHLPSTRGTKYRRPVEKPVPDELSPFLERWINIYRTRFPGAGDHCRLWSSRRGTMCLSQANRIICARTREAFGHAVNPHLFRDCAATTINTEFGAEAHLASAVLDHTSSRTTRKYYNQARMVDAVTTYQRHLQFRDGR